MKLSAKRFILLMLIAFLVLPILGYSEDGDEDTSNLPGDPECSVCHGTGKVQYGKKDKTSTKLLYCTQKDLGKRCAVKIGGWEPCSACEDWPDMQPIFDEHDQLIKNYRKQFSAFPSFYKDKGAPLPNVGGVLALHFEIYSNVQHSEWHGMALAGEESFDLFDKDFNMGGEESKWDEFWKANRLRFLHVATRETFQKMVEWWYNNGMGHEGRSIGLQRLKDMGGINIPGGKLSYKTQTVTMDEAGVINSASTQYLYRAFVTQKNATFNAWITEGYSAYQQIALRNGLYWYTVAYGQGSQQDKETWKYTNWAANLTEACKVPKPKFDEKTGQWKGLIPIEQLIQMKVTNISYQGLAQAWALNKFLLGVGLSKSKRAEAQASYKQLLGLIGSGTDQEAAFLQVYGLKNLSQLDPKYRNWIKRYVSKE